MDIRVLKYFLAAAREENITRAAESLHISQPSLSKQLMELEAELGKGLFIRGKRKLTLTEDGVLLRKRAEEIVSLLERTEQEISSDSTALSGTIAIGGMPHERILRAAAELHGEHPELCFDFYSGDAIEVAERLDHGCLDFAVLLEPVDAVRYEYVSLNDRACWGVIMPSDCELAKKPTVQRDDLRRIPLIAHKRIGLQRNIEHWAQTDMEQMNVVATYNIVNGDPSSFVYSGLGYFLTTDNHLSKLAPGLCFRRLEPPLESRHALIWRRHADLPKAAEAFLRKVRCGAKNCL